MTTRQWQTIIATLVVAPPARWSICGGDASAQRAEDFVGGQVALNLGLAVDTGEQPFEVAAEARPRARQVEGRGLGGAAGEQVAVLVLPVADLGELVDEAADDGGGVVAG
ncbi:MAG: hypothetical protein ACLFRD_09845, partial [Nitriliruptoraceae bacterium]